MNFNPSSRWPVSASGACDLGRILFARFMLGEFRGLFGMDGGVNFAAVDRNFFRSLDAEPNLVTTDPTTVITM